VLIEFPTVSNRFLFSEIHALCNLKQLMENSAKLFHNVLSSKMMMMKMMLNEVVRLVVSMYSITYLHFKVGDNKKLSERSLYNVFFVTHSRFGSDCSACPLSPKTCQSSTKIYSAGKKTE